MQCRVCKTGSTLFFNNLRSFFKCPLCSLIFTQPSVDKASEEKHYKLQWKDQSEDFWKECVDVFLSIVQRYRTPQKILDFGSGSGGLAKELQKRGFDVTPIEPMIHGYLKDQNFPSKFDVITALEVIEHVPNLWDELQEIEKTLTTEGIIVFTTQLTNRFIDTETERESFRNWVYKDDQTHVSFFCNKTLFVIAEMGNYDIDIFGDNVFVVRRKL